MTTLCSTLQFPGLVSMRHSPPVVLDQTGRSVSTRPAGGAADLQDDMDPHQDPHQDQLQTHRDQNMGLI